MTTVETAKFPFINTWTGIPTFYNKKCRIIKELGDGEVSVEFEHGATLRLCRERLQKQDEEATP
jgi:hypothetical protein